MIVYEVNLQIDSNIREEYIPWLNFHIREIVSLNGFRKAELLEEMNEDQNPPQDGKINLIIHYELETYNDLKNYFDNHAQKMREEGMKKFGGKFTATRRILKDLETFKG